MDHGQDRVVSVSGGFQILAANSLEEYRGQSFADKEPETVAWIEEMVKDGEVFYDIGANVGIYALFAAVRHPGAQIYAFEPQRANFIRLCGNARLNGVKNLTPLYFGLSDENGLATLYIKDERIGASGSQVGRNVDERGNPYAVLDEERVPVLRLDQMIPLFDLPAPHHIKIDVDGLEERILRGMGDLLAAPSLRSVLVEVNVGASDADGMLALFRAKGFVTDHPLNRHPRHSRHRRKGTGSEQAENIIFTRP